MTHADTNSLTQSNPGNPGVVQVRSLIAGGLLLLGLFLLLFTPVVGMWQAGALAGWLRNPLRELTTILAAVVAVLCLLRWRVTGDAQALRTGLAMALYGVGTLAATGGGTTTGLTAALQSISRLVAVALLGYGLVAPLVKTRSDTAHAVLVTLVTSIALTALPRGLRVPGLDAALPAALLLGLGTAYVTTGVREGRQLFAWTGSWSPALRSLSFGWLFSRWPVQRLCSTRSARQRFCWGYSQATGMAIEGATETLERYRDLLNGDTRKTLAAARQAEFTRLRTLLDYAPEAQLSAPFDLLETLTPVVVCANANGMRVSCSVAPSLRGWGSAAHIAQVVQQLLANADRHAPGSLVEISAVRDGDRIVVRVADHGPGVVGHLRERIFERGRCSAASAQAGGHGFGLAIARQLMDDQGGALWYEDRPGGGACFTLQVPAEQPSAVHQSSLTQYWG
jgi:signal transduction histidine kinase